MRTVAIVGAGPAGLVAARFLAEEGLVPVVFEQGDGIGGQWTGDPRYSGVWPSMRTNTSRVMTCFSDLPHPPDTAVYPTNQAMSAYLQRYAEHFDLVSRVRLKTCVRQIDRDPAGRGWAVRFCDAEGVQRTEVYTNVIIASGRFHKPAIPAIPGLRSFSGPGGVAHAFHYRQPERYLGRRILVAGCSISALEIASDLAMLGAARVISTHRRQRYVLPKLLAGVPIEHIIFTRFAALAEETFPKKAMAQGLREFILRTSGSPEQFGAPKPADNVLEAGITQSQHYLPLVAEGRIHVRPWIREVEGQTVRFADRSEEEVDAMIFGTGYELDLPFLNSEMQRQLDLDACHIDLYKFTFHPDLPGLAFVGMLDLTGPNFTVLELQARWVAYVWGGHRPGPTGEEMKAGIAAYRARRGSPQQTPMQCAALMFARAAGVEPELERSPELARALLFGPLTPVSFRMSGHDSLVEAPVRVAQDALAFGAVPSATFTPEQRMQLQRLAAARGDAAFTMFVERLDKAGSLEAVRSGEI